MNTVKESKQTYLKRVMNNDGIIAALAIDQRGSLKKMLGADATDADLSRFKVLVSEELTPFASSILLDPEYGLPAANARHKAAGLLLAYEKTGYDATEPGRLPDLLKEWSVRALKEQGADAIKFLLYYDPDESEEINHQKHIFMERVGSECVGEGIPFFLEIVSYAADIDSTASADYAKVKPHKVNSAVKEFSKEKYHVDVLKVEVPVNMKFVEGYDDGEVVYTKAEALAHFKEQSDLAAVPFIFLSAGVSAELFIQTLKFAKEANSTFNGVLCGRATWKDATPEFSKSGEEACRKWLQTEGKKNIEDLNAVLKETATPIKL